MPFKIIFTKDYDKQAALFFKKHPNLLPRYQKTLEMLQANPFHPALKLHPLKGSLKGIFSVSINLSYRITIDFIIEEHSIIPLDIGDHDTVYS